MKSKKKKFFRSRDDKMIAGVCGGLAEHFGLDSRLVRLIFIVAILLNGVSLLLYVLLWILFPLMPIDSEGSVIEG